MICPRRETSDWRRWETFAPVGVEVDICGSFKSSVVEDERETRASGSRRSTVDLHSATVVYAALGLCFCGSGFVLELASVPEPHA